MEGLEATPSTTTSAGSGSESSYVKDLLSAGAGLDDLGTDSPDLGDGTESTDGNLAAAPPEGAAPDATGEGEPDTAAAVEAPGEDPLAKLATEYGLDLTNPKQRAILEAFAKTQGAQSDAGGEDGSEDVGLSEFERTLLGTSDDAKPADASGKPAEEAKPLEPGKFGDVGDAWQNHAEGLRALNQAWAEDVDGKGPDMEKVGSIEEALFRRRFAGMALPFVQQLVQDSIQRALQTELGDVLPVIRTQRRANEYQSNYAAVVEGLKKENGFAGIDKLFVPIDSNPIKYNGREYDNTPMNRILRSNPELMQIRVEHKDPATAEKLTIAARLRAVMRRQKAEQGTVPAAQVREIVQAGQKIAGKDQATRTRQALNAGGSAAASGGSAAAGNSYIGDITRKPAGAMSIDDL